MKTNIKNFTLDELKEELKNMGEKPFRAEQVFKWLFSDRVETFDEMTNLSFDVGDEDGNLIESVLMSYHHGYTICVSSQIGCKMGCKFCASTGIPFSRNLEPRRNS